MSEFGAGLIVGILLIYLSFVALGFTTAVHNYDAHRAAQVCSKSAWTRIDRSTIYCLGGDEYPRKVEE